MKFPGKVDNRPLANEQMIKFWWRSGSVLDVPWRRYALSQCFYFIYVTFYVFKVALLKKISNEIALGQFFFCELVNHFQANSSCKTAKLHFVYFELSYTYAKGILDSSHAS